MLYFIGIGLSDEKDISLKGLEAVKECELVYLENYTSILSVDVKRLEELYGKKVKLANRELVEKGSEIIDEAKNKKVAFLVVGDIFSATTHMDLLQRAEKEKIEVEFIFNSSVLTAVGIVGLELYKFGKVISIPFNNENVKSPIDALKMNLKNNLHTLFLLDLDPGNKKFLSIKNAIEYLEKNGIKRKVVACARLGSKDFKIKYGCPEKIKPINFGKPPYCLIIPAKDLHFVEEEMLERWK